MARIIRGHMALQAGTPLGPYEVIALIGAGGMGQVYQARDTRLDRKVAVKVLAPALVLYEMATGRPEFEAKTQASLIAQIRLFATRILPNPYVPQYAVTADGQRFLGLDPVGGETTRLTFLLNSLDPNAR